MPTFWKPDGVNKEGAAYGEDVAYNKAVTEGFGTAIQADAAEGEYKEFGQPDDENAQGVKSDVRIKHNHQSHWMPRPPGQARL